MLILEVGDTKMSRRFQVATVALCMPTLLLCCNRSSERSGTDVSKPPTARTADSRLTRHHGRLVGQGRTANTKRKRPPVRRVASPPANTPEQFGPPWQFTVSCWVKKSHRRPVPLVPSTVVHLVLACGKLHPGSFPEEPATSGDEPREPTLASHEYRPLAAYLKRLLPKLSHLISLTIVAAGGAPIDLERHAASLSHVRYLVAEGNNCRRKMVASFRYLTGLRAARLMCQATDREFAVLGSLPHLRKVTFDFFDGPGVQTVRAFAKRGVLRSLRIPDGKIRSEELKAIAGIKTLETLSLRTVYVKASALQALANLPHLRDLELDAIWFGPPEYAALGRLSQLRTLQLIRSHIDDKGLVALGQLKRLRHLSIESRRTRLHISDKGIAALRGLTGLRTFTLGSPMQATPGIRDQSCHTIARLKKLRELRLPFTRITDECLRQLATLDKLSDLQIDSLSITAKGLRYLLRLKRLRRLTLGHAKLSTEALLRLKELPALKELTLRDVRGSIDRARLRRALPAVDVK